MASIERAKKLIEPYVNLLCEEIKATAEIANRLGLRLETVYFGGGTPTTLNAEQLNRVLKTVNTSFNMTTCREFTVEAGRPDTIDKERLFALNTDLIAGLPTDTVESFKSSLDSMLSLSAECITVHTLCMKRASTLTKEGVSLNRDDAETARKMLKYAQDSLISNEYIPYYLYRQSRMVGNLENVG